MQYAVELLKYNPTFSSLGELIKYQCIFQTVFICPYELHSVHMFMIKTNPVFMAGIFESRLILILD